MWNEKLVVMNDEDFKNEKDTDFKDFSSWLNGRAEDLEIFKSDAADDTKEHFIQFVIKKTYQKMTLRKF